LIGNYVVFRKADAAGLEEGADEQGREPLFDGEAYNATVLPSKLLDYLLGNPMSKGLYVTLIASGESSLYLTVSRDHPSVDEFGSVGGWWRAALYLALDEIGIATGQANQRWVAYEEGEGNRPIIRFEEFGFNVIDPVDDDSDAGLEEGVRRRKDWLRNHEGIKGVLRVYHGKYLDLSILMRLTGLSKQPLADHDWQMLAIEENLRGAHLRDPLPVIKADVFGRIIGALQKEPDREWTRKALRIKANVSGDSLDRWEWEKLVALGWRDSLEMEYKRRMLERLVREFREVADEIVEEIRGNSLLGEETILLTQEIKAVRTLQEMVPASIDGGEVLAVPTSAPAEIPRQVVHNIYVDESVDPEWLETLAGNFPVGSRYELVNSLDRADAVLIGPTSNPAALLDGQRVFFEVQSAADARAFTPALLDRLTQQEDLLIRGTLIVIQSLTSDDLLEDVVLIFA